MLSAPAKQAKRISSLFSLNSNKERGSNPSSPTGSPGFPRPSPDGTPAESNDRRRSSRSPQPGSSSYFDRPEPRRVASQGVLGDVDLDGPLPPPPSLLAVNHDLADGDNRSQQGRSRSRERSRSGSRSASRPGSSRGLTVPGSAPDSRPSTPAKRRSWMPGKSRTSSRDWSADQPSAGWIAGLDHKIHYDLEKLVRGDRVSCATV